MNATTRRGFLQLVGGLSLPAWFPRMSFAAQGRQAEARSDVLVCIFLRGGVDGLSAVVPYADDDLYRARPTLAIAPPGSDSGTSARDLDGFYGFHPALAPLQEIFQDGTLAVVHAVGSPDDTRSHFDAMDYMERGTPGQKVITSGWINRHLLSAVTANDSVFRAISIGPTVPASMRGPVAVTALQSIADFHLKGSYQETASFQQVIQNLYRDTSTLAPSADRTFTAIERLATSNPLQYQPRHGAKYPSSDFGLALRQIAQMIRAEVGLEVACAEIGGWDTHEAQGAESGRLAELLTGLAAGLHAFHTDMQEELGRVSVVVMTEFGRRLAENASEGTDHGRATIMLALGGGVEGGRVHTAWPGLALENLEPPGDLAVTTDFRTVLSELLVKRMRNHRLTDVFPGFEVPPFLGVFRERIERQTVAR
jgi:uncharacterized protein (DUF1501 family)